MTSAVLNFIIEDTNTLTLTETSNSVLRSWKKNFLETLFFMHFPFWQEKGEHVLLLNSALWRRMPFPPYEIKKSLLLCHLSPLSSSKANMVRLSATPKKPRALETNRTLLDSSSAHSISLLFPLLPTLSLLCTLNHYKIMLVQLNWYLLLFAPWFGQRTLTLNHSRRKGW